MGLFSKSKKATWKADSEGAFEFYLGDDLVDETLNNGWFENKHLIIFHQSARTYYIFRDFQENCDEEFHDAELILESDDMLYVHDDELSYYLFYKGAQVNNDYPSCRVDAARWFYVPEEGKSYVLDDVEKIKPYAFVAPALAGEDENAGFYYSLPNNKFRIVFRGQERSGDSFAQISDDDVLVHIEGEDRLFVIKGAMRMKAGTWKEDSFSNSGDVPLFKKIGANQFHLFDRGRNYGSRCKGVKLGPNAAIYDPEKEQNYWVKNAWNLEDGAYQDAEPFAQGCKILWYRNGGNDYRIYFETEDITRQVQLQRYENSAILMLEATMSMYQLENFFVTTDGVVRGV